MASHSRLTALPRELRDLVYQHYLHDPDGYHFNFDTCRLRRSDSQPIELSLMYTCRLIADEMRGVALKTNTVVFSTVDSETERLKAAISNWQMYVLSSAKNTLLSRLVVDDLKHYLTPEIENKLITKHPACQPYFPFDKGLQNLIGLYANSYFRNRFRLTPSVFQAFRDDMIELLASSSPSFFDEAIKHLGHRIDPSYNFPDESAFYLSSLRFRRFVFWEIPSYAEVLEIQKTLDHRKNVRNWSGSTGHEWTELKWNYSAAAAAIYFLRSQTLDTRLQLRSLLLREDRPSIRNPESHALGLIPFCQENLKLRIERQVSLWRNLYPAEIFNGPRVLDIFRGTQTLRSLYTDISSFSAHNVSEPIVKWIAEAVQLPQSGMPSHSFHLVFNGIDNDLDVLNMQAWDIFKEDIAWQYAFKERFEEHIAADLAPWRYIGSSPWGNRDLLEEIDKIMEGTSIVRCRFIMGGSTYDSSEVLDWNRERQSSGRWDSIRRWNDKWKVRMARHRFDVSPYLPKNWRDRRVDPSEPLQPESDSDVEDGEEDGEEEEEGENWDVQREGEDWDSYVCRCLRNCEGDAGNGLLA